MNPLRKSCPWSIRFKMSASISYPHPAGLTIERLSLQNHTPQPPTLHPRGCLVWVWGLIDLSIKYEAAEGMGNPDRSLRAVYTLAEQAGLINAEIFRLVEEEMPFYYSQPETLVQPAEQPVPILKPTPSESSEQPALSVNFQLPEQPLSQS